MICNSLNLREELCSARAAATSRSYQSLPHAASSYCSSCSVCQMPFGTGYGEMASSHSTADDIAQQLQGLLSDEHTAHLEFTRTIGHKVSILPKHDIIVVQKLCCKAQLNKCRALQYCTLDMRLHAVHAQHEFCHTERAVRCKASACSNSQDLSFSRECNRPRDQADTWASPPPYCLDAVSKQHACHACLCSRLQVLLLDCWHERCHTSMCRHSSHLRCISHQI